MDLKLHILGSSSAIPTVGRHPTAQFLSLANRHFLIDCGEGTQVRLRQMRIGFGRINHIMISHLHGDHFYGLVPLLTSLHLLDRRKEMHLYGPKGLEEGVRSLLAVSGAKLRYPLIFHSLKREQRELIYEDEVVRVHSFPLQHSIECWGFYFEEKPRQRNMRKEMLDRYQIPVAEIRRIKQGADWVDEDGKFISNEALTYAPDDALSYAYCTDTAPVPELSSLLPAAPSLMYHEATFTEEHRNRAHKTHHSTALQAAQVATSCQVKHLLLGHFSVRYDDLAPVLAEAQAVFPNSRLALEGQVFRMHRPEELKSESIRPSRDEVKTF